MTREMIGGGAPPSSSIASPPGRFPARSRSGPGRARCLPRSQAGGRTRVISNSSLLFGADRTCRYVVPTRTGLYVVFIVPSIAGFHRGTLSRSARNANTSSRGRPIMTTFSNEVMANSVPGYCASALPSVSKPTRVRRHGSVRVRSAWTASIHAARASVTCVAVRCDRSYGRAPPQYSSWSRVGSRITTLSVEVAECVDRDLLRGLVVPAAISSAMA